MNGHRKTQPSTVGVEVDMVQRRVDTDEGEVARNRHAALRGTETKASRSREDGGGARERAAWGFSSVESAFISWWVEAGGGWHEPVGLRRHRASRLSSNAPCGFNLEDLPVMGRWFNVQL